MQIVFPCPNCGANQNVDDSATSVECQFCGNTITVPENLRPKTPPPPPAAPQSFSFTGATSMPGMTVLPGMFLNMDINKLREMAMAARSGNKDEAARLYGEAFGVPPDQAMQAAELMMSHHPIVLSQMQFGTQRVIQMGGAPQVMPAPTPGVTYNLPSPPVTGSGQRSGGRWGACLAVGLLLLFAVILAGAIVAAVVLRAR